MYNSDLPNRAELPSKGKLLQSTLIALVVAAVLLVTVVLPSEYGIDPTGIGRVLGLTQMGEIKTQLAEEANEAEHAAEEAAKKASESNADEKPAASQNKSSEKESAESKELTSTKELTKTLKPGEGVEVKLEMLKGKKVEYEWTTDRGGLNHDTHGDGPNRQFQRYSQGRNVKRDKGEMIADFDGSHGWFWRNRSGGEVTVTLQVKGEYESIKQ